MKLKITPGKWEQHERSGGERNALIMAQEQYPIAVVYGCRPNALAISRVPEMLAFIHRWHAGEVTGPEEARALLKDLVEE